MTRAVVGSDLGWDTTLLFSNELELCPDRRGRVSQAIKWTFPVLNLMVTNIQVYIPFLCIIIHGHIYTQMCSSNLSETLTNVLHLYCWTDSMGYTTDHSQLW